tara:strand:+ start:511 stop:891 length:381 start_codon:yes stop_codon:yes gene_type:complete
MYGRYIGFGSNVNQALLYCRINQMGHDGYINKNKISNKTNVMIIDKLPSTAGEHMEMQLFFGYKYHLYLNDNTIEYSNTEYNSYKKLVVFFGKDKLNEIYEFYTGSKKCLALKEKEFVYRFMYLSK